MTFYPSKNNNKLNQQVFTPEAVGGFAMVNPHYRVDLAPGTRYIIDSGAFQERDMLFRLQPWSALDRQLRLEAQIEFGGCGLPAEAIVTYDMLAGVDEAIIDGKRVKRRGTEQTAVYAIQETLRSARYYATQVHRIRGAIAYAAQGVTPAQYLGCVEELIPLIRPGRDWLAFGGFCIIGMQPSLKKVFYETLALVLPRLKAAGIRRAHILGVTVADAIRVAMEMAKEYGIALSTDSSGPERNAAVYGREFDVTCEKFRNLYTKEDKGTAYKPAEWAIENIRRYHEWIETL